jgi:hypothetical protein
LLFYEASKTALRGGFFVFQALDWTLTLLAFGNQVQRSLHGKNGARQAIQIPRDFELESTEAII